jgi:hypothetical protein
MKHALENIGPLKGCFPMTGWMVEMVWASQPIGVEVFSGNSKKTVIVQVAFLRRNWMGGKLRH